MKATIEVKIEEYFARAEELKKMLSGEGGGSGAASGGTASMQGECIPRNIPATPRLIDASMRVSQAIRRIRTQRRRSYMVHYQVRPSTCFQLASPFTCTAVV